MSTYITTDDGRELLAIEVRHKGESVGWVEPADWHAFIDGDLDADGIQRLAALRPDPPTEATSVRPAPEPFIVEQVDR